MTGIYLTDDDCEYEIFHEKIGKPPKIQLMGRCIRSTVRDPPFDAFPISEDNFRKTLLHGKWKKIA